MNDDMRNSQWLVRLVGVALAVAVLAGGSGAGALDVAAKKRATPREQQRFENTEVRLGFFDGGLASSSSIEVSGFDTLVSDVNVNLIDFDFLGNSTQDIDVLLFAPNNRSALILSDVGGNTSTNNVTLVLDDQQEEQLPNNTALTSGFFQPTNVGSPDTMNIGGGPFTTTSGSSLGVFNGIDPNGAWTIHVFDDNQNGLPGAGGGINGGWGITITTSNGVPETEPDRFQAQAGKTLSVPAAGVLANDSDPDDDDLTANLAGQPKKGQVNLQPDGAFTYKAKKNAKGTDSFTYLAEDPSGLTALETVTIQIKKAKKKKGKK